ncbi:MAG: hypothetical protein ACKO16_16150 [Gemmataceae bacterium]
MAEPVEAWDCYFIIHPSTSSGPGQRKALRQAQGPDKGKPFDKLRDRAKESPFDKLRDRAKESPWTALHGSLLIYVY